VDHASETPATFFFKNLEGVRPGVPDVQNQRLFQSKREADHLAKKLGLPFAGSIVPKEIETRFPDGDDFRLFRQTGDDVQIFLRTDPGFLRMYTYGNTDPGISPRP
jgi:hypothetical protein